MSKNFPLACWHKVCPRRDSCYFYHDDGRPQVVRPDRGLNYEPAKVRKQQYNSFYPTPREPYNRSLSKEDCKPYYNSYSKRKPGLNYARSYQERDNFDSLEEGELSDHSSQATWYERPFPKSESYEPEFGQQNCSKNRYHKYNHLRGSSTDDTSYEAYPSYPKPSEVHEPLYMSEGLPKLSSEKNQDEVEYPQRKIYSKALQDIIPAAKEPSRFFGCLYKEAICGICSKLPEVFGVLIFCDHTFCFDCIKDHYEQVESTLTVQRRISCPICKCTSANIIPSAVPFPQGGNPKKKMIEIYLEAVSKQSCKHFMQSLTEGLPYCPFGNECLHAHPSDGLCSQERYLFSGSSDGQHSNSIADSTKDNKSRQSNISFDELLSRFDMQASSWIEETIVDAEVKHGSVSLAEDSLNIEEVNPLAINSYDLTSFVSGGLGR